MYIVHTKRPGKEKLFKTVLQSSCARGHTYIDAHPHTHARACTHGCTHIHNHAQKTATKT